MKKLALMMISILLGLTVISGCAMLAPGGELGGAEGPGEAEEKTPLEVVEEKYEKLGDAAMIEQEIAITQGEVLQYESAKTYTKAGSGYRVTGHVKQLNSLSLGKAEEYTETPVETTVTAGSFSVRLKLDELYFASAPTYADGVMEIAVNASGVETVFGLTEELPAAAKPRNMKLKIATDETHVTQMHVSYTSKNSEVHISLTFTY